MFCIMRTTLNIDDDVLESARTISTQRQVPIGTVVSELIRRGLEPAHRGTVRNGIVLFPVRPGAGPVTPEVVAELLDETA